MYYLQYSYNYKPGDYVLRLQLRHENRELLEKSKDLTLVLKTKLAKPIPLNFYGSWKQALLRGTRLAPFLAPAGSVVPVYASLVEA